MIGTSVSRHHQNFLQVIKSYYQLTKPRIIPLLLITTAGSMWIAAKGQVEPLLLLVTLAGGTLAAGAAQTINCIYDRDIDYEMERTRHRPLPSGRIQPRDALIFALALAILSFSLLAVFANLLSALLAMSGIIFYIGIYTKKGRLGNGIACGSRITNVNRVYINNICNIEDGMFIIFNTVRLHRVSFSINLKVAGTGITDVHPHGGRSRAAVKRNNQRPGSVVFYVCTNVVSIKQPGNRLAGLVEYR